MSDSGIPDYFAVLSAIWILACNDEISLITYRGIQHRLSLPEDYELRKMICEHGELFRLGLPSSSLETWKTEMRGGKRLPSWIRKSQGTERTELIDALKPSDGFRSQFRAAADAPPSEMAILEWGLGHIERLRKANSEIREAKIKNWQMWLAFLVSFLALLANLVVGVLNYLKKS